MKRFKTDKAWLIGLLMVLAVPVFSQTVVHDTIHHADGSPAHGSVLVSWPAFTSASGATIARGNTAVTLSEGGDLNVTLTPNAGASPAGTYYTAVYHLDDGAVSREYWVVPASVAAVGLSAVRVSVLPASVGMQTVTKQYVDQSIAAAVLGNVPTGASPYVEKSGDTLSGALVLAGDPTTAQQAANKNYVDTSVTALQGGLAQKISLVPAGTQNVTQPAGSELQVNRLNGGLNVGSFKSNSVVADGIANTLAQSDCASGCDAVIERGYAAADRFGPVAPKQMHGTDHRGGALTEYFVDPHNPQTGGLDAGERITVVQTQSASDVKAATGSGAPSSFVMSLNHLGLAGGNNILPQNITNAAPYFKSNFVAQETEGNYYTVGQHILHTQVTNCFAVGDCLDSSHFVLSSGGFRDNADEGTHAWDFRLSEDSRVFQGVCATGCSTGSTLLKVTATKDAGTQGEGRFVIDTNASKVISTGTLTGGVQGSVPFPTANFSGTSFPVSTFFMLNDNITPQALKMAPGVVNALVKASGVPSGYQTNTLAAPAASGVACVTDYNSGTFAAHNYEMANYTTTDSTHFQLTLMKPHAAGATVSIGGLCGYGLEQTVDTAAGVRQVFPVVGSISETRLFYAGGITAVVGVQSLTSAFRNVSLSIASIARSSGVVTVTTASNLPVDLNGATLTVAGVSDSSFNGSYAVTTTGVNQLTYTQSGANGTSSGGTIGVLTGGFALYPMAEAIGVINTSTRVVDGTMTLAPNTVAWASGDTVEMPHYYQEKVGDDQTYIIQQTPRPTVTQNPGVVYQGNMGPGMRGWYVGNGVPSTSYLGNGGLHSPPDIALQLDGEWNTGVQMQAGDTNAISVLCSARGCGRWNSAYNLFSLQSAVGGGATDVLNYAPQTSTMTFNLRGATYSLSPTAMTAGTINAQAYHETLRTPASSSDTCTAGDFTDDANYHYVCVATNTWKRVALSSF